MRALGDHLDGYRAHPTFPCTLLESTNHHLTNTYSTLTAYWRNRYSSRRIDRACPLLYTLDLLSNRAFLLRRVMNGLVTLVRNHYPSSDEEGEMPELEPVSRCDWRYLLMATARFKCVIDSRSINGSANSERFLMRHRKICRFMHSVTRQCGYLTTMLKLWHRTRRRNLIELRLFLHNTKVKLWRYSMACLIHEWNQRTTRRQYLLLLLNVEFKLQQYFATCLIREWRSNKNTALLRYTRSIGHASIVMLLVHMHFITKVVAAYRASSLIKSW